MLKKVAGLTALLLLFFTSTILAVNIDTWYIVEKHIQDGKEVKRDVLTNEIYRSEDDAFKKLPENYIIPEKKETIIIPASTETEYWLVEKQNSGDRWVATGNRMGPYDSRTIAMRDNPGERTEKVSLTQYYIREVYRDLENNNTKYTGKEKGTFTSIAEAQNKAINLGFRDNTQVSYIVAGYLNEFTYGAWERWWGDTEKKEHKTSTLLSKNSYDTYGAAINAAKAGLGNSILNPRREPANPSAIDAIKRSGTVPNGAAFLYSGQRWRPELSLDHAGYTWVVYRETVLVGRYYWEVYSINFSNNGYRWELESVSVKIPEYIRRVTITPIKVTYDVVKNTAVLDLKTYLIK